MMARSTFAPLCMALLLAAPVPAAAQSTRTASQVLKVFNDICLATIGDAFASAGEKARESGFRSVAGGSFVELDSPHYSGGWSRRSVPRGEKYCEIGSTTANRRELIRLIEQRLRLNTGQPPRRARHPDASSTAWWIPHETGRLYYTVTVGMNDDPNIGATARITFALAGN